MTTNVMDDVKKMTVEDFEGFPTVSKTYRCDRCGAHAAIVFKYEDLGVDLGLCGHHLRTQGPTNKSNFEILMANDSFSIQAADASRIAFLN